MLSLRTEDRDQHRLRSYVGEVRQPVPGSPEHGQHRREARRSVHDRPEARCSGARDWIHGCPHQDGLDQDPECNSRDHRVRHSTSGSDTATTSSTRRRTTSSALVNDAVYIARQSWQTKWTAVGAQFQHPYVYKTLFSGETSEFNDLCETKQVQKGAMYLDFEHERPAFLVEGMTFVGKTGRFVPVKPGYNGGVLWRVKNIDGVDKNFAVTGTKGYLWVEAEHAKTLPPEAIDYDYFEGLAEDAIKSIEKFGSFEELVA